MKQDKSYSGVLNVAIAEELVKMKNRLIISIRTQLQVRATSTYKSQSRGQQNQAHQHKSKQLGGGFNLRLKGGNQLILN